uniref:Transmembrane protein n=1 Tax=Rhodosorus marinus TaxID=101924 RepID=A0A7S0BFB5_9RHOD
MVGRSFGNLERSLEVKKRPATSLSLLREAAPSERAAKLASFQRQRTNLCAKFWIPSFLLLSGPKVLLYFCSYILFGVFPAEGRMTLVHTYLFDFPVVGCSRFWSVFLISSSPPW